MTLFRLVFVLFFFSYCFGQNMNSLIIHEAQKYQGGGYVWDGTGVLKSLSYKDSVYLEQSDSGSYCSGFTLTLAFEVLKKNNKLSPELMSNFYNFYRSWYGVPVESREKQCVFAINKYKIGKEITLEQAKPGDFIQFWRNNKSGHSVVFLAWEINDKNEIIGVHYKSSQKLTYGVGDRCEFIGAHEEYINPKRIYISRLNE